MNSYEWAEPISRFLPISACIIHFSLSGKLTFSALSKEEKDILDFVIEKLGKMSKNEIISFMHKEQAYVETAPRDIIQFKYAENLQI